MTLEREAVMNITVDVDGKETQVYGPADGKPGALLIIMIKVGSDGQSVIGFHEPCEVDSHPDTVREIGGQIVTFVNGG